MTDGGPLVRSILTTLLELAGLALIVAAAWTIAPAFGLAAAGFALIAVGVAVGGRDGIS